MICTLLESLITAYFEVLKNQCGCPLLNMEKLDEAGLISVGGYYNHNFFPLKQAKDRGLEGLCNQHFTVSLMLWLVNCCLETSKTFYKTKNGHMKQHGTCVL